MAEARQQLELTADEQAVIERMRMSPADRRSEIEARTQARLAAMTPEMRQAMQQRAERVETMTPAQRRHYLAAQRLTAMAASLRRDVQRGLNLSDVLAAVEPSQQEDLDWLLGELTREA